MNNTFSKIRKRYNNWKLERTTIRELSVLSDRDLTDIGIYRTDIKQFVKDNRVIY